MRVSPRPDEIFLGWDLPGGEAGVWHAPQPRALC